MKIETAQRYTPQRADCKAPLVAGWSLTSRCNLRCCHCYGAAGCPAQNELSTSEACRVVRSLHEASVSAVNFGGGECALRPDFLQICDKLRELGIKVSYTTNGTVSHLFRTRLDLFNDIGVSIDFAAAGRHDRFRGKAGTFTAAVSTLQELVAAGVETEMVTCLTHQNCRSDELRRLHDLASSIGVGSWRLNRFRASGRGLTNEANLALSRAELRDAFQFLSRYIGPEALVAEPLFRAAFGGCYINPGDPSGISAFRIQADGEVSPSVFLHESGGSIRHRSIGEIFSSPIFSSLRNRQARGKCRLCPAYAHCRGGDAGASYLASGHFNGPDPLCWVEPDTCSAAIKQVAAAACNVHQFYLCTLYIPINARLAPNAKEEYDTKSASQA